MRVLEQRVDRNGTKHQTIETNCSHCGGAGKSDKWIFTGSVCYKCNGTGLQIEKRKIYTKEYEEKLEVQRKKRQLKKK